MVCVLIDNDTRHHRGQNFMDSRGADLLNIIFACYVKRGNTSKTRKNSLLFLILHLNNLVVDAMVFFFDFVNRRTNVPKPPPDLSSGDRNSLPGAHHLVMISSLVFLAA